MERALVYLDHASLLRPDDAAVEAMAQAARTLWGQPKALHPAGRRAEAALEGARLRVAEYLGATAPEVVFVASGREALALGFELALAKAPAGAVVSSRQEHPALQKLVEAAAARGRTVRWLDLPGGVPNEHDQEALASAALVALSLVGHELGTVMALDAVAPSAVRLLDAVQAAPWIDLARYNDDLTFYAFSGSKLGGVLGAGVLRVPPRAFYDARAAGAPLESDSPPWAAAIALGEACARRDRRDERLATAKARGDRLLAELRGRAPGLVLNGEESARLGPIVNVSIPGVRGKDLAAQLALHDVCITHTTACRARFEEQGPGVRAAYPDQAQRDGAHLGAADRALGATRWSVSESTTNEEIDLAMSVLDGALALLRRTG